jgi:putative oxidoreductase
MASKTRVLIRTGIILLTIAAVGQSIAQTPINTNNALLFRTQLSQEFTNPKPTTPMNLFRKLTSSNAPNAVLLIRLMVGAVFLSEGIQKFLFPADIGAGRFAKIGLPSPEFLSPFVGSFEIACGTLVLLGLLTRFAVIPLLTIMAVALYTTKLPIFLKSGFWKMAHEARTDFSMVMGALLLLLVGAGAWSLDAWLNKRAAQHDPSPANKS